MSPVVGGEGETLSWSWVGDVQYYSADESWHRSAGSTGAGATITIAKIWADESVSVDSEVVVVVDEYDDAGALVQEVARYDFAAGLDAEVAGAMAVTNAVVGAGHRYCVRKEATNAGAMLPPFLIVLNGG